MKKMIFVLLSLVMVFAFVGTAAAAITGNNSVSSWNPPGPTYSYPGVAAAQLRGAAYWTATDGSPHKNYSSTSNKCEVCHSPHQAGNGVSSFKLLYGTTAATGATGACTVCHVSSSLAIRNVYDSTASIGGGHDLGAVNAVPDTTWATANATLGCSDCHTVHGAGAIGTGAYILRANPTWNSVAYAGAAAVNETQFCTACHDKNYSTAVNGITHYMGQADAGGSTGGAGRVLSTAASTNCDSCHNAARSTDDKDAAAAKWPHQSVSIVGLGAGYSGSDVTDQADMDDHCLKCHSAVGTDY